jgi:hypothetical protein
MDTFDYLLNWKLKVGSHRFPGPNGGTCINEAALVAAGFDYKPIQIAEQMPGCFSRPICSFAMRLNDHANDEERQRLLPYVTRLACADTKKIEAARAAYIHEHSSGHSLVFDFERNLAVLEGALAIGRQADLLGPDQVQTRMGAARVGKARPTRPAAPTPTLDKTLSKVKGWLTVKETELVA